ncbi:unnamed protein product [Phyllotreta striolata]|uniref:Uncharacterized protein n=1 Tax=Phyllotreta striolata TaxID=444603 RepID=A0A9N9TUU3_PHYSR|nr:unnamed protein product [Phyllotreta striolata]
MESGKEDPKLRNPESNVNAISKLFFVWTVGFFKKFLRDPELYSELPALDEDEAGILGGKLEYLWRIERKPVLWKVVMKMFGYKKRLMELVLLITYAFMRPGLCILLAVLIRTFREEFDSSQRYLFGSTYIVVTALMFAIEHFAQLQLHKIALRIRAALSSLIYRKVVKINSKCLEGNSKTITQLLVEDFNCIENIVNSEAMCLIVSIQFINTVIAMWVVIGFPSLTGLLFTVTIVFPLIIIYNQIQVFYDLKVNHSKHSRIQYFKGIMEGIKTIKMNNWEAAFVKILNITHQTELQAIRKYLTYQLSTLYGFLVYKCSIFISMVSIYLHYKSLQPEQVYPCAQFLFIMLIGFLYWIPKKLKTCAESTELFSTATKLLQKTEIGDSEDARNEKPGIHVQKLCYRWSDKTDFDLRIDDIKIKSGALCLVIGPQKSGKTSLLQLLLKEQTPRCGKIEFKGSLSYCSQRAWLYRSSIRNNILFGRDYREAKYKNITGTCKLLPDFSRFMNGDLSAAGHGGIVFEEDLKTRINLARAIYHEADIYLIDDVFPALNTGDVSELFENCFTRYLARKTRIIVANYLEFLDKADQIIVVYQGRAKIFDNLTEIKNSNIDIYSWMNDGNAARKSRLSNNFDRQKDGLLNANPEDFSAKKIRSLDNIFICTYKTGWYFCFICLLLILSFVLLNGCDFWLAYWTSVFPKTENSTELSSLFSNPFRSVFTITHPQVLFYNNITIYITLILITIGVIIITNSLIIRVYSILIKKLYGRFSDSVLRAALEAIITDYRSKLLIFMKDVSIVNLEFPKISKLALEIVIFSACCLLLVYTTEYILIFSLPLVIVYLLVQNFYLEINKILINLTETARLPILWHLKDTLEGVVTVRIHEGQEKSVKQFDKFLNYFTSLQRLSLSLNYSFVMISDALCSSLLFIVIFSLILINDYVHRIDSNFAGFIILEVYLLTEILQYSSKNLSRLAFIAISVKKLLQFSDVPDEKSSRRQHHDSAEFLSELSEIEKVQLPPQSWPECGQIEFKNVSMMYFNAIRALDDVNFTVKCCEKIGVVGRAGSGKSSLVTALFNLRQFNGTILIDNFNTKLIDMAHLRGSISIIQQPVMFSNCSDYKLDIFGDVPSEELMPILDEMNLKEHVKHLEYNWSKLNKGQLLLFNLALAIVKKNKILIIDEEFADVDKDTEGLFYKSVKKYFSDCTVVHITSNLNPIIVECDRVAVMEKGQIVEYDHPFSLLESEGSFYNLVLDAGKSVYSHYRHLAYQKYLNTFK